MTDLSNAAEKIFSGEMTIIDYVCELSAADSGREDCPSDLFYWESVRDARKNGKKLVFISGPAPLEILYALDCVPLYLDLLPARLSQNPVLTAKLINEAETRANASLCSLNKTNTGLLLKGVLGVVPDAFVSLPIPCDSARTACTELGRIVGAPSFHFDIPLRKDSRSLKYVEMQLGRFIGFIESIASKELDWEALKYRMELSNRAAELLEKCAALRAAKPCPLSSRLTIWNELMNAFAPTQEMEKLLTKELELCERRTSDAFTPCPDGEKHRVMLMHNLLWQGITLTEHLEASFGAVTVLDGFLFGARERFTRPDDKDDCFGVMSRRMLEGSRAHAAGASGDELLDAIELAKRDFSADVFLFLGSAGCRHAWASMKMVSDSVQEKYGQPMLLLDIDNTDSRYKSENEIKNAVDQYMDTVINKK
ncbi:MAG: 2-hydroxyacyl-CoA dehydratase [Clostridia bacterium]|nr:2-hydroxyacyl-CoA dehydratase [Clostridia bacterium]